MSRLSAWGPILAKVENKFQGWKLTFLSIAGKLTLIKNMLNNLPTYMGMFTIPKATVKKIVFLQHNFF